MIPEKTAQGASGSSAKPLSGLDPARKAAVAKRAADMPESMRLAYLRAAAGTASPRAAIKAHCLECCGWDRAAVAECTARACALFAYRPGALGMRRSEMSADV